MKKPKSVRKILSLVLAIVMLASYLLVPCGASGKTSYLVLGDSIGAGTGLANPESDCFGAIVAHTGGYSYRNLAENGNTTYHLISQLYSSDTIEAVENADIISISIGGNDFLHKNIVSLVMETMTTNDYSRIDEIIADFKVNLEEIVCRVHEINPDSVILVQTLYNSQAGTPFQAMFGEATGRLKDAVVACCNENPGEFTVVDVRAAFSGHVGLINADTIHPNATGHRLIAETLVSKMHEMGLMSASSPDFSATTAGNIKGGISGFFASIGDFFAKIFDFFAALFN